MTKPILWLGPLDELDADYDPLLGRSAAQPREQAAVSGTKKHFDPSRSVFDDPVEPKSVDNGPLPIEANTLEFAAPPSSQARLEEPTASPPMQLANEPEPEPELQPESESEQLPAPLTVHAEAEPPETTDFTHNNEPIPARYDLNPPAPEAAAGLPTTKLVDGLDQSAQTSAPKKSFFTNLFAKRLTPIVAAQDSGSISDVEAVLTREPTPTVEPEQEPPPELLGQTEVSTPAALPPTGKSPQRANIWDEISAESDDTASGDGALSGQDEIEGLVEPREDVSPTEKADAVPTEALAQPEAIEALAPPEPESMPQSMPETVLEDTLEAQDEIEPEADPISQPVIDGESALSADTAGEIAPPSKQDFQRAFNADRFWTLPSSQGDDNTASAVQTSDDSQSTQLSELTPEREPEPEPTQELEQDEPDADASVPISASVEPEVPDVPVDVAGPETAAAPAILAAPQLADSAPKIRAPTGKRRKRKAKKNYIGAFFGTFLFGVALFMTLVSSLAAFGYPFDMISSYRWYWIILSVCAAGIWGLSRGWKMVAAAFAVMGINLFVTVPATGDAPQGGKTATAVIGWANVAGNADALARVFKDAEKKKATLLMLAETPQSVFTPPAGWTLIEAPVAGDPTAIAVLSKSTWRAVTIPGEPTMARPPAGDLTVIGVHPQDASKGRRRTPNRDALINRAGTRAGIQDGPTIVIGDFNAAPWDKAMNQFRNYGNVTRVRCGGWAGTTLTQTFGLFGVATDHAYVRDVKVTHCQLGSPMTGGNHKPIWLYVAPQPAPPAPSQLP